MDKKNVFIKKIRKLWLALIPSKSLRRKIRKKLIEKDLNEELKFVESPRGEKELLQLEKSYPNVMTTTKTLKDILQNKLSVVRYGDGELNMVLSTKKSGVPFQNSNLKLEKRLREILRNNRKNILVCIPTFTYKGKDNYKKLIEKEPPKFWERYWLNHKRVIDMFNLESVYGNAFISRSHSFYDNNLELIKKIWDKKEVVFVYGENGRFKIEKRLFENIIDSEEILIPPVNAFDSYDEILNKCLKKPKDKLFLIAAGPTATVLAYDLAMQGYQALDIGHLPNSYHEFLGEIISPELLPKELKEGNKNEKNSII